MLRLRCIDLHVVLAALLRCCFVELDQNVKQVPILVKVLSLPSLLDVGLVLGTCRRKVGTKATGLKKGLH